MSTIRKRKRPSTPRTEKPYAVASIPPTQIQDFIKAGFTVMSVQENSQGQAYIPYRVDNVIGKNIIFTIVGCETDPHIATHILSPCYGALDTQGSDHFFSYHPFQLLVVGHRVVGSQLYCYRGSSCEFRSHPKSVKPKTSKKRN